MGREAIFGERKCTPCNRQITEVQQQTLQFMWCFYQLNDQLPTFAEIASHFGVFPHAATCRVQALARKGFIEPNACPGRYRFTFKAREMLIPLGSQLLPTALSFPRPSGDQP